MPYLDKDNAIRLSPREEEYDTIATMIFAQIDEMLAKGPVNTGTAIFLCAKIFVQARLIINASIPSDEYPIDRMFDTFKLCVAMEMDRFLKAHNG